MICEFYNSGLEYQENLLVKYYRKHGHEVTVVASTFRDVRDYYNDRHDSRAPRREFMDQGARIIQLPYRYNILNRLRAYVSISDILDETKPDLIYVHDIMPNIPEIVRYLKHHGDCRVILDYHADYSNSGKNWLSVKVLHGVVRRWLLDLLMPYLSAIYPVVPGSLTFLHEVYGVPHQHMEVLPLGADLDLVEEVRASGARVRIRERLGIGDDTPVIFTGGKLDEKKKTELLIDAVCGMDREVHLIIAGDATNVDSPYKSHLYALAAGNPNIHFTGWLKPVGVYEHMLASDLAVFPASQSIMWQQAIASGLPLVAGDVGGQDISYLNLDSNIVVLRGPEISTEHIGNTIEQLLSSQVELERMSAGARKVADTQLSWDHLVERTLRCTTRSL